jgi:hypothetical protein
MLGNKLPSLKTNKEKKMKPGMVVYTHNPSPGEAEAGRL